MTHEKITVQYENENLTMTILEPVQFTIPIHSRWVTLILTILLNLFQTLAGKRFLTQKQIGELLGYSRQNINMIIQKYKQGGFESVLSPRSYHSQLFTDDVREYLKRLWYSNPFLTAEQIIGCLIERFPHLKDASLTPSHVFYHIDQDSRFSEFRKVLKQRYSLITPNRLEFDLGPLLSEMLESECNRSTTTRHELKQWLSHVLRTENWLDKLQKTRQKVLNRCLERCLVNG